MLFNNKTNFTNIVFVSICLSLVLLCLSGCNKKIAPHTSTTLAMGTVISQSIYDDDAQKIAKEIDSEIKNLENINLSWRIKDSDINRINSNSGNFTKVDDRTIDWIKTSIDVSKNCNGVFDLTVGPLIQLWNIGSDDAKVPTSDELSSALKTIDYKNIIISGNEVKCGKGQNLDLGAIGKGVACDQIANILDNKNVKGATISVGGSILLYGKNPNAANWALGIRNPIGKADDYVAILKLDECFVSTSGDYERVFEKDGISYHHILDPRTGYPAKSELLSVTVICNSGLLSDALSTACFILGYENSISLLEKYDAQGVFIDKDLNVYVTKGIQNRISITEPNFKLVKGN